MPKGPYPNTDRDLIRLIERSPSHRAGYKQLIRELGLGGGRERRLLLEQLARITLRGELVKLDTGYWALPRATPEKTARVSRAPGMPVEHKPTRENLLAGKLDLHRDGFGFVRPNGSKSREDDLFIPPNEINGAMQGDEVLVDEAPVGRDGRRSGRIARVLTRRNPTVVGIFHYARAHGRRGYDNEQFTTAKFNYITPLDERMTQPILILDDPDGEEGQPKLPPQPDHNPHRVLGEEAQRELKPYLHPDPDKVDPLEGLAVDVEIVEFPTLSKPARGRILEVLGHPDDFGVDVEIIIRKHHLPYTFPTNVLAEATASASQTVDTLTDEELAQRTDFRGLPIVTIDGETARDFDDAVLVQPLPNGNWQLQVHIADVSHYVRPGTALDLEARLRGTSVYFPDRAVPMLPPQLSSGMCSLRPDEDRLVLTCIAEIDKAGEVAEFQLCEGIIRSARRMTYTQVQKILDGDPETRAAFIELVPAFEQMHELALLLNRKRHRRGSIDFDLPEAVIQFDPQGNMAAITRSERGWSNRLIEEFMLTANECVAHWLEAQGPSIYRIHELPDPKRILDFEDAASVFGQTLGFSTLPVKQFTMKQDRRTQSSNKRRFGSDRAPQKHEVPESIPVTPQMYQRLTAKIAGTPEERILSFLMLRSLKQARYSEKNEGHFALASPSYTHFTSPIRRYPDLIVHRLLRAALQAGAEATGGPILSTDPQPWSSKKPCPGKNARHPERSEGPPHLPSSDEATPLKLPEEELSDIALESSQAERRADEAERELMEWKKIKFMQDRVGEDFHATVLSCTKYGFYVELDELFIEGMVPIQTIADGLPFHEQERFFFRDTDRAIVGQSSGRTFKLGQRVHVLLDRIDRPNRRLQFALVPAEAPPKAPRKPKAAAKAVKFLKAAPPDPRHTSPTRTGKPGKTKPKARERNKKAKGKRR
ncbi:RNAse R [Granulicella rosea]|uniref:Ribonuclease R n=1 Tax=Granulicella rosea TaxID=474952 RepID=A0A239D3M2_9BACT|nr:RNB domain-containing ribonuclease [Granulicella rosea]SNS26434.1 RNAse R [Granulicella rosea]